MDRGYEYYRKALEGEGLPCAFLDLELLQRNIQGVIGRAGNKKIRIHSKALRSIGVIRRILESSERFSGVMCSSAPEAIHLRQSGIDDLLIAYPTVREARIESVCREVRDGGLLVPTFDSADHLDRYQAVAEANRIVLPVSLDVDMATRFPFLHFGSHWSSVDSIEGVRALLDKVRECPNLRLAGVVAYEGQIAGLPDRLPGHPALNRSARVLKAISIKKIRAFRKGLVDTIRSEGFDLDFVNGGGTMSLTSTSADPSVTEVSPGSAFYAPALFDYYAEYRHLPAAGYAVEVTRKAADYIVCYGGGYNSPGIADKYKQPVPYLSPDLRLTSHEGAGEVQTPLMFKGSTDLQLGDPVFFRTSCAGELCERFNHLALISDGKVVDRVTTYRGDGKTFF
ncbi:MAG: alanine racemase [Actinobacteria bacterium]|nr:alanine racemase [Actinomycetota bacterium]MBU1942482.1 alanine racemase [Actinomycetota bacterium]MBU2687051.1 alanine racemase [Actinomycetota bacterium]